MAIEQLKLNLYTVKLLHILLIVSVLIYVLIVYIMDRLEINPNLFSGDPILNHFILVLSIMSIVSITFGSLIFHWMTSRLIKQNNKPSASGIFAIYIVRSCLFESVGVFGLILAIMGAGWGVIAPFFSITILLLIFTFPTKERLEKLAGK